MVWKLDNQSQFGGGLGVGMMFVYNCLIFRKTALYTTIPKGPHKEREKSRKLNISAVYFVRVQELKKYHESIISDFIPKKE